MKNFLVLFLLVSLLTPAAHAQLTLNKISPDTFRLQKFPVRYFFSGEKLRKPKQVQSILLAQNDFAINRDWQAAKTTRAVGTGVMVLGLVLEGLGLLKQAKGDESGINLMLGGIGVMLGGSIIQAFSNRPTKRAMRRYNDLQTGRIAPPLPLAPKSTAMSEVDTQSGNSQTGTPSPLPGRKTAAVQPCPCIGFRTGVNASKFWEIGGSEAFKTDEKTWWAKSLPLALVYELPGTTPGHATQLELALVSKGFRIKSEATNSSSSTQSRSDLQLRFLQVAALKKIPIGTQDKKLRLHGAGGLFVAYAVNARQKTRSVLENDNLKKWTRSVSKYELGKDPGQFNIGRLDAGLALGAGASYPLGPGRLSLDLRLSVGAINLEKSESPNPELKYPSLHTRDVGLWVGWSTNLPLHW